jgi:quinol-cytochrome oxidoreductase complex cytochrome b subunit
MVVDPVLRKVYIASIFLCEFILITLVGFSLAATEYVGLETRYEVLEISMSMA